MKCLSLKQPFAELILRGRKTIELRTWNTRFRGRFLIHASAGTSLQACRDLGIDPGTLEHKAIVGSAVLYGVKEYRSREEFLADLPKTLATSEYMRDRYGFLLKDVRRLDKPIPLNGRLGFFEADVAVPQQQGRL